MVSADDVVAIEQLYAKYSHHIDTMNTEKWIATLAPDAVLNISGYTYTAPEEFRAFAQGLTDWARGTIRHYVSTILVEETDGIVRGSAYLQVLDRTTGRLVSSGVYEDTIRATKSGWVFSSRTLHADEWDPAAAGTD